jgi:hypothetical protein
MLQSLITVKCTMIELDEQLLFDALVVRRRLRFFVWTASCALNVRSTDELTELHSQLAPLDRWRRTAPRMRRCVSFVSDWYTRFFDALADDAMADCCALVQAIVRCVKSALQLVWTDSIEDFGRACWEDVRCSGMGSLAVVTDGCLQMAEVVEQPSRAEREAVEALEEWV